MFPLLLPLLLLLVTVYWKYNKKKVGGKRNATRDKTFAHLGSS